MNKKAILTILFVLINITACLAGNGFTLVIDAGHGGHDTGAQGASSMEKDINLRVALAFGQYVEQNCKDVNVIYTRKTDVFIPLKTRANIANKNNADLFVSVHTNALPNGRIARGFEVYTLGMHRAKDNLDVAMRENSVIEEEDNYKQTYQGFDPKSSESYIMFEFMQSANMRRSVELAKMIESSVCSTADRNNMGVHQAGFLVLRETSMPSCLIELGFITTPDEEEFLNTDEGVDKMANGIYKAFVQYKDKYHDKVGFKADNTAIKASSNDKADTATTSANNRTAPATVSANNKATADPKAQPSKSNPTKLKASKNAEEPVKKQQTKEENHEPVTRKKVQPKKTTEEAKAAPQKAKATVESQKAETKKSNNIHKPKAEPAKPNADSGMPVFKVQVFAVARKIQANDPLLKGRKDAATFQTPGSSLIKYTIGSSTDYAQIVKLRDSLRPDFPQAYIIAFKNGKQIDLSAAISEYKKYNRKQRNK